MVGKHAQDGAVEQAASVPWRKRPRAPLWSFDTPASSIVPPALAVGTVAAAVLAASMGLVLAAVIWALVACSLVTLCVIYMRRPLEERLPESEAIDWSSPNDSGKPPL